MPELTIDQAFQLALHHHQARRLAAAEPIYRQILQLQPGHSDALHLLGLIALSAGRAPAALDLIEKAIALQPNLAIYHNSLGQARELFGQPEAAEAAYRLALQWDPDYSEAHNNLGNLQLRHAQLAPAIDSYQTALRLNPDFASAHTNLGNAYLLQGDRDAAVLCLRRAVALNPQVPSYHCNLGNALAQQRDLVPAIACYQAALRLDPNYATAHSNLGNVYKDQGELEQAIACYQTALRINPNDASALSNLGCYITPGGVKARALLTRSDAFPSELESLPIRIRNGITIHVPNSLNALTAYVLLEQEAWFEDEIEFASRYLRPGECAVDIGANFGVYTTAMAKQVGAQGTVFAFEPAAETCRYLRTTVALRHSSTVQVVQAALSNRSGTADLLIGSSPELNALVTPNTATSVHETVSLLTLDEYLANWPEKKISFVKLDAEGHDHQVVEGAWQVIQRDEPLIMFEIKSRTKFDLTLLDLLQPLGFTGFCLMPGLNVLVPFERATELDKFQLNLFAATARRAKELEQRGLLVRPSAHLPPAVISSLPTGVGIIGGWATQPAIGDPYAACLTHYAQACSATNLADQIAHLSRAFRLAREACQESPSMARIFTLARLAGIFGQREQVFRHLAQFADELTRPELPVFTEPFLQPQQPLAPSSGTDHDMRAIVTGALETLERARHHSSFYGWATPLPLLEHICRQPHCSPEMHRRRQLVRMRTGLQRAHEPHPLLVRETVDNLNAWFWKTVC